MNVRETARRQYGRIVDQAAATGANLASPAQGWLFTLRKALGMSGSQVADRMGVTRAAVYQAERNERIGAITIAQMEKLAKAMGGRFIYAVVPNASVEAAMRQQARKKAEARIFRASAHMALENQALPNDMLERRIEEAAEDLLRSLPADFWEIT